MRFVLEPPVEPYTIEHYRCDRWSIDLMAFLLGQYRIQIWWKGPEGCHWRYPDMIQPNF